MDDLAQLRSDVMLGMAAGDPLAQVKVTGIETPDKQEALARLARALDVSPEEAERRSEAVIADVIRFTASGHAVPWDSLLREHGLAGERASAELPHVLKALS